MRNFFSFYPQFYNHNTERVNKFELINLDGKRISIEIKKRYYSKNAIYFHRERHYRETGITRMILLEGVKPQYAVILSSMHAEAIITHPFNVSHRARAEIATCIFVSLPSSLPRFADLLSDHLENSII